MSKHHMSYGRPDNTMAFPEGVPDHPVRTHRGVRRGYPAWAKAAYLCTIPLAGVIGTAAAVRGGH